MSRNLVALQGRNAGLDRRKSPIASNVARLTMPS
jgi:hypothetical protein